MKNSIFSSICRQAESQDLDPCLKLATGVRAYHHFVRALLPDSRSDLLWARGLMHNYVRQCETGICCLLKSRIDEVRECIKSLDKMLANLKASLQ